MIIFLLDESINVLAGFFEGESFEVWRERTLAMEYGAAFFEVEEPFAGVFGGSHGTVKRGK
jgi:hypothetical protein